MLKKYIAYLGIKDPSTKKEVEVEIAGLKHAISVASERIANLEQALTIADLQKQSGKDLQKQSGKELEKEVSE